MRISLTYVKTFWGSRYDGSALAPQFAPFEGGPAITVHLDSGRTVHGTVSVTGGWQPVYTLLSTSSNGRGWITLTDKDMVTQ